MMQKYGKHRIQLLLCAALLLTGCGPAPDSSAYSAATADSATADATESNTSESSTTEPQGKPVLVHLRLNFTDKINSESINTTRQLRSSIYLQQQALQYGSGQDVGYSLLDTPVKVMGSLQAQGQSKIETSDLVKDESYQMAQFWPVLTENPAGRWRIVEPEPSNIGEGVQFKLEMVTPVSGTKHAKISSKGQTFDTDVQQALPLSCGTDNDHDQCALEFSFDAIPTVAKNEFGTAILESAKTLYQYQGKKGPDGALVMFGPIAPIYGAVTSYEGDRLVVRFSQQFTENLDSSVISQQLQMVMWTSAPEDSWQPDDLPPLTTTAAASE
jgi:hypothetical protein